MGGTRGNVRGSERPSRNIKRPLGTSLGGWGHAAKVTFGSDLYLRRMAPVGLNSWDCAEEVCEELVDLVDQGRHLRNIATQVLMFDQERLVTSVRMGITAVDPTKLTVLRRIPRAATRPSDGDLGEVRDYEREVHLPSQVVPVATVVVAA